MLNVVPRSWIAIALAGAVALAFATPAAADDVQNSAKSGAHDGKHADSKHSGGKSVAGKGDKGKGDKGLAGGLGRVDGAIATGLLGLGVLNAITNANAPPAQ